MDEGRNYYELLGVDKNASVEVIKAAFLVAVKKFCSSGDESLMQYNSFYSLLGLENDCRSDEIKPAFYKAAKKFHPDSGTERNPAKFRLCKCASDVLSDTRARKEYDEYLTAYEILTNPEFRAQYDKHLFGGPPPAEEEAAGDEGLGWAAQNTAYQPPPPPPPPPPSQPPPPPSWSPPRPPAPRMSNAWKWAAGLVLLWIIGSLLSSQSSTGGQQSGPGASGKSPASQSVGISNPLDNIGGRDGSGQSPSVSIDSHEVTLAEYQAFQQDRGMAVSSGNPDNVVVGLTWNDALAYCRWKGQRSGSEGRLPYEAEWMNSNERYDTPGNNREWMMDDYGNGEKVLRSGPVDNFMQSHLPPEKTNLAATCRCALAR